MLSSASSGTGLSCAVSSGCSLASPSQFSLIAVTGSIFLLYGYGLGTDGPAFIWPFIVGGVFQVIVGLSMAELVSAFPLAGARTRSPGSSDGRFSAGRWAGGW